MATLPAPFQKGSNPATSVRPQSLLAMQGSGTVQSLVYFPTKRTRRKRWYRTLIRPQQLGLRPRTKSYWSRALSYQNFFTKPSREDEVYYEDDVDFGSWYRSKATFQHIFPDRRHKREEENENSTDDDDELEALSVDGSEEDFKDVVDDDKYWSCDEEELDFYSSFEDSEDEIDPDTNWPYYGDCMRLSDGDTIIHRTRGASQVKKFLYLGYDIETKNGLSETPLQRVARYRNLDVIKSFISAGANVNARSSNGANPLIVAISFQCSMEVIKELLKAGADYSTVMNYFKENVMHRAWTGELVREFWRRGAKVDLKDICGYTPLHRASRNRNSKTELSAAQELIRLGADVNCRDDYGKTPLYHAVLGQRWDVMITLIKNGADLSEVISDQSFPTGKCTALDKTFNYFNRRLMGQVLMKHVLFQSWARQQDFTNFKKYLLNRYNTDYVDDHAYKCIAELSLMNKYMIDKYSLLDIIKTQIPYQRNPLDIDYGIEEHITTLFPIYCTEILDVIKECKLRRDCLAKIKQNILSFASKDITSEKSVLLNYDCVLMICEYLSGIDLLALLSESQ